MRTNILKYTITFKCGGHVTTVNVTSNNIVYAVKRACKVAEYCSDYITEIHAIEDDRKS